MELALNNLLLKLIKQQTTLDEAKTEVNQFINLHVIKTDTDKAIKNFANGNKREELKGYFTYNDYNIITDSALLIASKKAFKGIEKSKTELNFAKIFDNPMVANIKSHSKINLKHLVNAIDLLHPEDETVALQFKERKVILTIKFVKTLCKCTNWETTTIYQEKENSPIYFDFGKDTMAVGMPLRTAEKEVDFYITKSGDLSLLETDNLLEITPTSSKKEEKETLVSAPKETPKAEPKKETKKEEKVSEKEELATDKQRAYIRILTGKDTEPNLTKKEASKLITKIKSKR